MQEVSDASVKKETQCSEKELKAYFFEQTDKFVATCQFSYLDCIDYIICLGLKWSLMLLQLFLSLSGCLTHRGVSVSMARRWPLLRLLDQQGMLLGGSWSHWKRHSHSCAILETSELLHVGEDTWNQQQVDSGAVWTEQCLFLT